MLQDTAIILNFSIFPPCLKISNKGIITSIIHWMVWKYFSLMLFNIKTTTAITTNLLVLCCQPNVATPTTLKVQNGFSVFKLTSSDCIGIYYKDCPKFSWLKRYGVVSHNSDPRLAGKVGEEYHLYISNFQWCHSNTLPKIHTNNFCYKTLKRAKEGDLLEIFSWFTNKQ